MATLKNGLHSPPKFLQGAFLGLRFSARWRLLVGMPRDPKLALLHISMKNPTFDGLLGQEFMLISAEDVQQIFYLLDG